MDAPLNNLPPELSEIALRLERGGRLSCEQASVLFEHEDLLAVASLADAVAERKWGGRAFYATPLRLTLRPLCAEACGQCPPSTASIETRIFQAVDGQPHEVHLLGLPDGLSLDDVENLLKSLRSHINDAWIQGFTPGDIATLGKRGALDVETVAMRLQQAGLDAILGTHEEVYTDQGRILLGRGALDETTTLSVHVAAHRAGMSSIATLLYEPGFSPDDLIVRMHEIREVQRKTGGFSVFAPLPLALENGDIHQMPGGYEDMRIVTVARLFFDNIPHVRVPWLALGLKMGQVALRFGGDDLGWPPLDPHVRTYAPRTTFTSLTVGELERAVVAARRKAIHVDGAFRERRASHRHVSDRSSGGGSSCEAEAMGITRKPAFPRASLWPETPMAAQVSSFVEAQLTPWGISV